ncbi:MAG TPA: hypothetical protein VFH51_06645 [Myxococcota bacterium]|nr:hypothetical protein [Myxococcota bacterium]
MTAASSSRRWHRSPWRRYIGACGRVAWLCVMGVLTWQQTHVWHDNASLWTHNITHFPNSGMAHAGMGDLAASGNRLAEARRHYERAHALQPQYTNVFLGLGYVDLMQNRPHDCVAHLRAYLTGRPDNTFAREMLAAAYEAVGRHDEAGAIAAMLRMERSLGVLRP